MATFPARTIDTQQSHARIVQLNMPIPAYTEQEIIAGCRKQNRQYQEALYHCYYSTLAKICFRYAGHTEDAEQLVHDGFMRIFTRIDSYKGSGSFEGWMKRVTINCCLDHLRTRDSKNARITHVNQEPADLEVAIHDNALDSIGYKQLLVLIQELPPMTRTVFNMFVFDGMSHKEISTLLDISIGTSYWHVNQARTMMQKKINKIENFELKQQHEGK